MLSAPPSWFSAKAPTSGITGATISPSRPTRVSTYEESYAEENFFCEYLEQWVEDTDHRVDLTNGRSVYAKAFRDEERFREYLGENDYRGPRPSGPEPARTPNQEAA